MQKAIIISIVYHEPEWQQTKACIEAAGLPVYYVERNPKGIGSLAEAINRGFIESNAVEYKYAWIVTNVTFTHDAPVMLQYAIHNRPNLAILHPAFESDHYFCRPDGSNLIKCVPFVEFTAPIVRTDIFKDNMLDESMPFWGHDPDFGIRMWQQLRAVAVDHGTIVGHIYIRNNTRGHEITKKRFEMRKATDISTKAALARKYGPNWRWMFPRDKKAVDNYFRKINDSIIHSRQREQVGE